MGANAFNIRFKESNVKFGHGGNDASVSKRGLIQKKSNLNMIFNFIYMKITYSILFLYILIISK